MGVINILILEMNSKRLSNLVKVTEQRTGPEFEPSSLYFQSRVFLIHLHPLGRLEPGPRHPASSAERACHRDSKTMGRMSNVLVLWDSGDGLARRPCPLALVHSASALRCRGHSALSMKLPQLNSDSHIYH